jgi:hypothetical protein
MNKHIRLLIENITDDIFKDNLFNTDDDYDIIGKQIFEYNIGDIYYKDSKPYAMCCLLANEFDDTDYNRFILLPEYHIETTWSLWNAMKDNKELHDKIFITDKFFHKFDEIFKKYDEGSLDEYDKKYIDGFIIKNISDTRQIDEYGYDNTQYIKKNYDINYFPAFKYCCELDDNAYLPSIDELQLLGFYQTSKKINNILLIDKPYYSSTSLFGLDVYTLYINSRINCPWVGYVDEYYNISGYKRTVAPFIKIDN